MKTKQMICKYTTLGVNGTRTDTNRWNQMTPHFLEEVVGWCYIIARYPDNADIRWYEMQKICKNVDPYEEFERLLDKYLYENINMKLYKEYIKKHFMSQRAEILKNIIEKYHLY